MKKCISLLLCLLMLTSSCALADDFSFRGGVKWGMSHDEVIAVEGEPTFPAFDLTDNATCLMYDDVSVSDFTACLQYAFVDGSLMFAGYFDFDIDFLMMTDEYNYLKNVLTSIYGEPSQEGKDQLLACMESLETEMDADGVLSFNLFTHDDANIALFIYEQQIFLMYWSPQHSAAPNTYGL